MYKVSEHSFRVIATHYSDHSSVTFYQSSPSFHVRPMMIVSTVDGKVLALDIQNAGQQQWSMDAGVGPLLSSSISQFEVRFSSGYSFILF